MTLTYIKEEEGQHLNDQHLMVIGIKGIFQKVSMCFKSDAVSYIGIGHEQDWKCMIRASEIPFLVPS